MKKNYENNQLIITTIFFFMVLSLVFLLYLFKTRYRTYIVVDSVLISDNYMQTIITSKELKLLNSSKYVYIDNKKRKRRIVSVERNVLNRNKNAYHEVILNIKLDDTYKDNDYVKIALYNKKERIINIFKNCFKEVI